MEIYDIVKKLVGEIQPIGETNEDNKRFESLTEIAGLAELLLEDIHSVSMVSNRHEASMSRAGRYASEFLRDNRLI